MLMNEFIDGHIECLLFKYIRLATYVHDGFNVVTLGYRARTCVRCHHWRHDDMKMSYTHVTLTNKEFACHLRSPSVDHPDKDDVTLAPYG
jgi:hypothetical protein